MVFHLLLDMDGTLIDSSPGVYKSFCCACDALSLPHPSIKDFSSLIGPPVQTIASSLYHQLCDDRLETFRRVFRDDYDTKSYLLASWYPSVLRTILYLKNKGIRMTIVTNKPTQPAYELVAKANIISCFDNIIGIDYLSSDLLSSNFESKAESLSYALDSSPYDLNDSIYLGDTYSDQQACEQCQLSFVAALYGFYQWETSVKPETCITTFKEICPILGLDDFESLA